MDSNYIQQIENALLEHRYRYYVLDHPVVSDYEYDWIERHYESMCAGIGHESIFKENGVGFPIDNPRYQAAMARVQNGKDRYGLWEQGMRPVWDRLGLPKYMRLE